MDSSHRSYEKGKTVAQVATPPGEGGVAIIRISGDEAFAIGNKIFSKDLMSCESHRALYGKILSLDQSVIDQVLILPLRAPRSFTGEDTIEIHCHGGSLVTAKILQRVFDAGALPALAGEFSFKAFMNGKIDLSQAEAIQEMIMAKSEKSLQAAKSQLEGALKETIQLLQKELAHIAAIFEAWVDYPEEGLEFASYDDILLSLSNILEKLNKLAISFHEGKLVKQGVKLALIGAPNAGKSSLMNALIGKERAIVTDIAGTTRDTLDVDFTYDGIYFILTDTAGIRETEEIIEKEGIKRSYISAQEADLILHVIDSSSSVQAPMFETNYESKTLTVFNKIDLAQSRFENNDSTIHISAKNSLGIDDLKRAIKSKIFKKDSIMNDQIIITKERHHAAILNALNYLHLVREGLQSDLSPELLSIDIKASLKELGTIIGTDVTEDILNAIFSQFCVGK